MQASLESLFRIGLWDHDVVVAALQAQTAGADDELHCHRLEMFCSNCMTDEHQWSIFCHQQTLPLPSLSHIVELIASA